MKLLFEAGLAISLLLSPIQADISTGTFHWPEPGQQSSKIEVVAHRGASGYAPENTMAAFDKAVEMGADAIELDVHRSKDGELVVIHDATVDRTTDGTGRVQDLTLEELKSLDAGGWMGWQFAGEKIPTLAEVLDRYSGKIKILIELKTPDMYPGIEEQVADMLRERRLDQPQNEEVMIQSFNFDSMKKMKELLPGVPVGVLTSSPNHTTDEWLDEFATYADYFNPHYSLVTEDLVTRVRDKGLKIGAWTVRTREAARFLVDMKVDAIITDYPDYVHPKTGIFIKWQQTERRMEDLGMESASRSH